MRELFKIAMQALAPATRRPRQELVEGVRAMIPTIVANLLLLHQGRPNGSRLVVETEHRKRTRYDRPGFRKLPELLKVFASTGHIKRHEAVFKRKRTTITAAGDLKWALGSSGVDLSCISRVEGEELIILNTRPAQTWVNGRKQPKELVDYQDTKQTRTMRKEMMELNSFLSSHSITLEGSVVPPPRLYREFTLRKPTDPHEFNLHGRVYGGFWMNLKATERHRLRIDGEPIADLDFSSMFPRLAYLRVGQEPPPGDLYAVPGLEDCRDGAKAGFSALLSYPHEMRNAPPRLKRKLPKGWTARMLKAAIAQHHPHLVPCFEKDLGLDLMFTESQILVRAMMSLMRQGVPALPMHDGMMVPETGAVSAIAAMKRASQAELACQLPITRKQT